MLGFSLSHAKAKARFRFGSDISKAQYASLFLRATVNGASAFNFQMKILALAFLVTGMGVIAALWLMIVEGLIVHALSKSKLRRMHSALMRDSRTAGVTRAVERVLPLFEFALVFVRLDHVARHSGQQTTCQPAIHNCK
jgi:hypothetical protein